MGARNLDWLIPPAVQIFAPHCREAKFGLTPCAFSDTAEILSAKSMFATEP